MFFFVGLFVMVGGLEETGAIKEVADAIAAVTNGDRTAELLGIAWVSAIGSGIIDNIPFTATMIPVVEQLQGGTGDGVDDPHGHTGRGGATRDHAVALAAVQRCAQHTAFQCGAVDLEDRGAQGRSRGRKHGRLREPV